MCAKKNDVATLAKEIQHLVDLKEETRLPFFIHEWAMKKDLIEEIST
jgi:hypothetical protein